MLKGHPKGLYVAFFASMGERFGFYTMMAIMVLFLQAKFGLAAEKSSLLTFNPEIFKSSNAGILMFLGLIRPLLFLVFWH